MKKIYCKPVTETVDVLTEDFMTVSNPSEGGDVDAQSGYGSDEDDEWINLAKRRNSGWNSAWDNEVHAFDNELWSEGD